MHLSAGRGFRFYAGRREEQKTQTNTLKTPSETFPTPRRRRPQFVFLVRVRYSRRCGDVEFANETVP